ncbi:MAG TPA: ABC transporter ATP-binding protein [Terriglobia bacterium]|nr:ABC transporter ATP-binding protein [Terriglobia bacterium]
MSATAEAMIESDAMIEIDGLVRQFGSLRAVDKVSFRVQRGQVLGFIGPNGAGKTTTMRILATLDVPQEGDARIGGFSVVRNPEEARRITGFMPDYAGVYASTTVAEYLDFFARSQGLRGGPRRSAVEGIIEFMGIGDLRDRQVDSLSKGLQQRVALGRAIVHNPAALILDEPAANLDPRARIEFRALIRELAADGKTILLSSHILTELAEICDTIAVIEKGAILATGTVDEILQGMRPHRVLSVRLASAGELERFLLEQPGVLSVHDSLDSGTRLEFEFDGGDIEQAALLQRITAAGFPVLEFRAEGAGLEDLFMKITAGNVQ